MPSLKVQSRGKTYTVKVDGQDRAKCKRLTILWTQGHPYARVDRTQLLHRVIKKPGPGKVVHHRNNNTLDDRRSNLEVLTQGQNVSKQPRYARVDARRK